MKLITCSEKGNITLLNRVTKLFFIILCTGLLFFSAKAFASTYYVSPTAEVPLRIAPDSKRKILAILSDGAKVELIRKEGDWANVRTSSGKEGWILKRYLSPDPPLKDQLKAMKEENARLKDQLKQLTANASDTTRELDRCITERDEISAKYENLRQDAANAINTKKLLERTTRELNETKQKNALLKSQLEDTRNNQRLKWFLAGGGVLLTGWILGVLFRKRERRRSSLL